jgi:hypothetical protein
MEYVRIVVLKGYYVQLVKTILNKNSIGWVIMKSYTFPWTVTLWLEG